MNNQHQSQLNQNEAKLANTTTQPYPSSSHKIQGGKHERTFASGGGGGLLPGRKTDTYTTTERTAFGGTKTTVTTTRQASGGFIPYIPGKSTTTTTTTKDIFGNTRSVETNTQKRGGFGIIPLGPVGLAACGVIYLATITRRSIQPSTPNLLKWHIALRWGSGISLLPY